MNLRWVCWICYKSHSLSLARMKVRKMWELKNKEKRKTRGTLSLSFSSPLLFSSIFFSFRIFQTIRAKERERGRLVASPWICKIQSLELFQGPNDSYLPMSLFVLSLFFNIRSNVEQFLGTPCKCVRPLHNRINVKINCKGNVLLTGTLTQANLAWQPS